MEAANHFPAWSDGPVQMMREAGFENVFAMDFMGHYRVQGWLRDGQHVYAATKPITSAETAAWIEQSLNPGPTARVMS